MRCRVSDAGSQATHELAFCCCGSVGLCGAKTEMNGSEDEKGAKRVVPFTYCTVQALALRADGITIVLIKISFQYVTSGEER